MVSGTCVLGVLYLVNFAAFWLLFPVVLDICALRSGFGLVILLVCGLGLRAGFSVWFCGYCGLFMLLVGLLRFVVFVVWIACCLFVVCCSRWVLFIVACSVCD